MFKKIYDNMRYRHGIYFSFRKCKYFRMAPKGYKCLCTKCGGFRVRCSLERCPHFKPSLWGRILGTKKR